MNYNYIIVALIFIVLDILSGVLQSLINGTFESKKMRIGGLHKLLLIFVIGFGIALDFSQKLADLGFNFPCLTVICLYITAMEIMSIIENINLAFPNALPKSLVRTLKGVAKENGINTDDVKKEDDE